MVYREPFTRNGIMFLLKQEGISKIKTSLLKNTLYNKRYVSRLVKYSRNVKLVANGPIKKIMNKREINNPGKSRKKRFKMNSSLQVVWKNDWVNNNPEIIKKPATDKLPASKYEKANVVMSCLP